MREIMTRRMGPNDLRFCVYGVFIAFASFLAFRVASAYSEARTAHPEMPLYGTEAFWLAAMLLYAVGGLFVLRRIFRTPPGTQA